METIGIEQDLEVPEIEKLLIIKMILFAIARLRASQFSDFWDLLICISSISEQIGSVEEHCAVEQRLLEYTISKGNGRALSSCKFVDLRVKFQNQNSKKS